MPKLKEMLNEERGQALMLTALSFSMLLAFMALAVDTGVLFRAKRRLQVAADAAAVAGTLDYLYNRSLTSATTAAQAASSQNGFTDGSGGVSVTVSDPPADGPNTSSSAFLEAIVSKPVGTYFMGIAGFKTVTVKARAVAGTPTAGQTCIWVMAPSGPSMELQGSYDIEAPGCGVYVNSPSSQAFSDIGSGGTVNAAFLDVVGNSTPAHQTNPTATTINTAPRKSPWGDFDGASPSDCTSTSSATSITSSSIPSGIGAGNVVCFTQPVTLQNVTLGSVTSTTNAQGKTVYTATSSAGTLLFEKGVTLSGTVSVYGGTVDIYGGTFSQGNATLNVVAPTTGSLAGMGVVMSTADTTSTCNDPHTTVPCLQVQFGSSSSNVLEGYVYAPGAEVYMQDNGGGISASGIVAGTMYDKSSPMQINESYDSMFPGVTPNRVVTLVE